MPRQTCDYASDVVRTINGIEFSGVFMGSKETASAAKTILKAQGIKCRSIILNATNWSLDRHVILVSDSDYVRSLDLLDELRFMS